MIITCLLVYLVLMIVVGRVLSQRMESLSDFFLAGRSLSGPVVAITFTASWFGAASSMGSMTEAFHHGLSAMWLMAIPSVLSCVLIAVLMAKPIRRLGFLSPSEAVEHRYGTLAGLLFSLVILAATTTLIASQLVAAGHMLDITMGLSPLVSILVIYGAINVYAMIGGFRAVVMTDILQFVLFTLAILILLGFVLMSPHHMTHQPDLDAAFFNPWLNLKHRLGVVFAFVLAWSIAPEMWQRMAAIEHEKEAQRAILWGGVLLACLFTLVIVTGLLAAQHVPVDAVAAQKNVLLALAQQLPHPLLTGVVLIGVLSALTSTIDSTLNVSSLTFTNDIVKRFIWPQATPHQLVHVGRLMTLGIGIPAVIIALYYQDIMHVLWLSADIYASAMFIPMMGMFYVKQAGKWAGLLAICFGIVPVLVGIVGESPWVTLPVWFPKAPLTTLWGVCLSLSGFALGLGIEYYQRVSSRESAT